MKIPKKIVPIIVAVLLVLCLCAGCGLLFSTTPVSAAPLPDRPNPWRPMPSATPTMAPAVPPVPAFMDLGSGKSYTIPAPKPGLEAGHFVVSASGAMPGYTRIAGGTSVTITFPSSGRQVLVTNGMSPQQNAPAFALWVHPGQLEALMGGYAAFCPAQTELQYRANGTSTVTNEFVVTEMAPVLVARHSDSWGRNKFYVSAKSGVYTAAGIYAVCAGNPADTASQLRDWADAQFAKPGPVQAIVITK